MSTDTTEAHKDWILNVIDQLRKRKARPDLERICHFVERKYGLDRKETEGHLEKLVDTGVVIKVVYKRGTSYRNATKERKRSYVSNVLNSKITSTKINEAVDDILKRRRNELVGNGDSSNSGSVNGSSSEATEDAGVSAREIEIWIKKNGFRLGPFPIPWMIQREVDAGNLRILSNGRFLPCTQDQENSNDDETGEIHAVKQKSASVYGVAAKRGRPPKRKIPVDRTVSWNEEPREKREPESAPVPVMQPHSCDFCRKTAENNKYGVPEELLFCKDCNAKAHPSCMNYSQALAARARNTAWQCIDCKICCICTDPGGADSMLFCDACDKGYHMSCHKPKVTDKIPGKWICTECMMDGVDIDDIEAPNSDTMAEGTTKSTDSDSVFEGKSADSSSDVKMDTKIEEDIPNAFHWTTSDVVSFFRHKGFTEEANVFKEQEIDGKSLLLLKRSDVIEGLSLKLGPALKIYDLISKLQNAWRTKFYINC